MVQVQYLAVSFIAVVIVPTGVVATGVASVVVGVASVGVTVGVSSPTGETQPATRTAAAMINRISRISFFNINRPS
ncbi:MAG: hypothetical protein M0P22_09320 [Methanoculleus sp.]|nr:hypothetical protein [Methanoculleus sp.]